jgi:hypothetical protein
MNSKSPNIFTIIMRPTFLLSLFLSFFNDIRSASASGTTRYVKSNGVISGSCNGWGSACELSYVLNSIPVSGDQIWVQAGIYKPTGSTDRTISFTLKNGVAIYGGFNGTETSLNQRNPASNVAILSGEIGVVGSGTNNTAILDGFTITAGNASNDKGGGMWNYTGSPTLMNLIFNANSAQYGGGLYNENSSNPTLINVIFSNNQTNSNSGYGAGI